MLDHRETSRRRRKTVAWLAAAASLVLVVGLVLRPDGPGGALPDRALEQVAATQDVAGASQSNEDTVSELIAMSQILEGQLRNLRESTGSIPADSAAYVAELQDLVAQVDSELSMTPDSVNLWGQRVNLLLDLAQIYQHQWEREYGRMASL
ncbi:MAG: hypothetical protein GWM87_00410 [Xanthomonadales bacterium]|nr:hypothetical protein [Xanthomonadales bacterium]NIX11570.1 hypothetical protein [Xanthomonadales bacterium]